MDQLKKQILAVAKELKKLAQKTERMAKEVDRLEKPKAVRGRKPRAKALTVAEKSKAKAKPARKRGVKKAVAKRSLKSSAIDNIFKIISSSSEGVDTATIEKKSGFNKRKIWDNINRLKRQGKVTSAGRGVYAKA